MTDIIQAQEKIGKMKIGKNKGDIMYPLYIRY